jgi:hypothetical protein
MTGTESKKVVTQEYNLGNMHACTALYLPLCTQFVDNNSYQFYGYKNTIIKMVLYLVQGYGARKLKFPWIERYNIIVPVDRKIQYYMKIISMFLYFAVGLTLF